MTKLENNLYEIMAAIHESKMPVVFMGAMTTNAILEANKVNIKRAMMDIDLY